MPSGCLRHLRRSPPQVSGRPPSRRGATRHPPDLGAQEPVLSARESSESDPGPPLTAAPRSTPGSADGAAFSAALPDSFAATRSATVWTRRAVPRRVLPWPRPSVRRRTNRTAPCPERCRDPRSRAHATAVFRSTPRQRPRRHPRGLLAAWRCGRFAEPAATPRSVRRSRPTRHATATYRRKRRPLPSRNADPPPSRWYLCLQG